MKTPHIILVLIAIAIVAALAWYFVLAAPTDSQPDAGESPASAAGPFTGTLTELADRGGEYRCTLTSETNGVATDGVVYVAGERVRGDFTSTVPQFGEIESHMLADGTMVHTWSSMTDTGFSMPQTEAEATDEVAVSGQSIDVNQSYSYDCAPWATDERMFALPDGITFRTI
ncbi:MAG TPA: hypothetical protein VHO23_00225 [Candidatus Paceibacterota bacterium]|nr:hypothetical protein [Candidatus Paceibacterota bacterium]